MSARTSLIPPKHSLGYYYDYFSRERERQALLFIYLSSFIRHILNTSLVGLLLSTNMPQQHVGICCWLKSGSHSFCFIEISNVQFGRCWKACFGTCWLVGMVFEVLRCLGEDGHVHWLWWRFICKLGHWWVWHSDVWFMCACCVMIVFGRSDLCIAGGGIGLGMQQWQVLGGVCGIVGEWCWWD